LWRIGSSIEWIDWPSNLQGNGFDQWRRNSCWFL